jgi:hypothetical protein
VSVDKLFSLDAHTVGRLLHVAVAENEMTGIRTVTLQICLNQTLILNGSNVSSQRFLALDIGLAHLETVSANLEKFHLEVPEHDFTRKISVKLRNVCKRFTSKIESLVSVDKLFSLHTYLTLVIDLTPKTGYLCSTYHGTGGW